MIEEVGAIRDVFEELEMLTQHKETWFDEDIEKSFLQGQERGREAALLSVARNMLKCGRPVREIAEVTGLQPETIQSLMH
jgi:hypothetical protein